MKGQKVDTHLCAFFLSPLFMDFLECLYGIVVFLWVSQIFQALSYMSYRVN